MKDILTTNKLDAIFLQERFNEIEHGRELRKDDSLLGPVRPCTNFQQDVEQFPDLGRCRTIPALFARLDSNNRTVIAMPVQRLVRCIYARQSIGKSVPKTLMVLENEWEHTR